MGVKLQVSPSGEVQGTRMGCLILGAAPSSSSVQHMCSEHGEGKLLCSGKFTLKPSYVSGTTPISGRDEAVSHMPVYDIKCTQNGKSKR